MPVSKKRKRKRIGRSRRWSNYQKASKPFRSNFFVDLYKVNPQMTSQILIKLLPAILGCPLSFFPSPPPLPSWLTASFFGKEEVLVLVHIWAYIIYISFILCMICSSRVFKCLSNFKFLAASGCFFGHNSPNAVKFFWNCDQ